MHHNLSKAALRMNPQSCASLGDELLGLSRAWLRGDRAWLPAIIESQHLWSLARRHGVDGLAGGLVAAGAVVPAPLDRLAFESYCNNALRFQQVIQLSHKIRDAAQSARIPLSFVKGPALASAYRDEGVRGFGDLDILVPDGNAARALAKMCGLEILHGDADAPPLFWKRAKGIGRVEAGSGRFGVEFTFASTPANQPLHELYRRWPERYLLPADSSESIPVPAPEAHLLFLLQHLAQHWCDRLIWRVDFVVLMRSEIFDADWLEHAANRLQMRKFLRGVTAFCRRHLDEAVPELGCGRIGWKDGLYLSLLSPQTLTSTALSKYGHQRGGAVKDALLGAFQHVFATDMEKPVCDRRHAASRWMGEWLQHVLFPGGSLTTKLGPLVTPIMFLAMTIIVCTVFRRSPRGFTRKARRWLSDGASLQIIENQNETNPLTA
jgi:hypothetical protein